jgi:hypothetical protein
VHIVVSLAQGGQTLDRVLLADSGAGSLQDGFDLILEEDDCLLCGGNPRRAVSLGGAYSGSFPTYTLSVRVPALGFHQFLRVVGVSSLPVGFDGIACYSFLNRFTFGNFGDPGQFGLEL